DVASHLQPAVSAKRPACANRPGPVRSGRLPVEFTRCGGAAAVLPLLDLPNRWRRPVMHWWVWLLAGAVFALAAPGAGGAGGGGRGGDRPQRGGGPWPRGGAPCRAPGGGARPSRLPLDPPLPPGRYRIQVRTLNVPSLEVGLAGRRYPVKLVRNAFSTPLDV